MKCKFIFLVFIITAGISTSASLSQASSSRGKLGINVGSSVPFLGLGGLHYFINDKFNIHLGANSLDLSSGVSKVSLTMPELILQWHPFAGSFYLGLGVGQETLTAKAADALTGLSAEVKVEAMTSIARLGWMWGVANGGFWFGIDMSSITPSGAKTTITADIPTTSQEYIDAVDAGNKFGNTSFASLTLLRLGYVF